MHHTHSLIYICINKILALPPNLKSNLTVYVDDFVIHAASVYDLHAISQALDRLFAIFNMTFNRKKTRIVRPTEDYDSVLYLGLHINPYNAELNATFARVDCLQRRLERYILTSTIPPYIKRKLWQAVIGSQFQYLMQSLMSDKDLEDIHEMRVGLLARFLRVNCPVHTASALWCTLLTTGNDPYRRLGLPGWAKVRSNYRLKVKKLLSFVHNDTNTEIFDYDPNKVIHCFFTSHSSRPHRRTATLTEKILSRSELHLDNEY